MSEPARAALAELRPLLLDRHRLVRAVAAGSRASGRSGNPRRADLRPVELKAGPRLQVTTVGEQGPQTRNHPWPDAAGVVDALLTEPYASWLVETTEETLQLRVTKRGKAQLHRTATTRQQNLAHDRAGPHLIEPDDPLFGVIGASAAKRRQVDAFLRALDATLDADLPSPLRVVDLGCGNAYLTFAAYRYLTAGRGLSVELVGVDARQAARDRNAALAAQLGYPIHFMAGAIADVTTEPADVALALHACDTATDEALARAIGWRSRYIVAAPCCHHDLQTQLRASRPPAPYGLVASSGILHERLGDVLTDALRAALLRLNGYQVEVVEFTDFAHTARNVLLRARRTGVAPRPGVRADYDALIEAWGVQPRLAKLLETDT